MKVFVTGATGFVGTAVVQELLANGHQVLGLARSEESANKLIAAGAEVHRGDLNNFESLKSGATASDAVIHLGFVHDFTRFEEMCQLDEKVIKTIGDALLGTEKPFIITSGTALFSKDKITTEKDIFADHPHPRIATENSADFVAKKGVKVAVIRLSPSVHGNGDIIGFVPTLIRFAKETGKSAIINDGKNFWPAVHKLDVAKLYRLALEKPFESRTRYHAVAEQGIPFVNIATIVAERLNVPVVSISEEEVAEHFGWFAHFAKLNNQTSSEETKSALGWNPQHPTLIEDLKSDVYFPEVQ
ncbi:SDR family oxidoreductase [Epilithonimonas sp. UC225_85]|uniref:SDR family oxidoreductase n=1 Tax=Epilithonimonas sp. UC225_85 TaxID=3350167 RepID=UPI0036D21FEF